MAGDGSSGGGGFPGGPLGALLAALMGLGAAGVVTWIIVNGGGGRGGNPTPVAVATQPQATVAAPSAVATSLSTRPAGSFAPSGINKEDLKEGFEDAAVLVLTAYGSPARLSADADNPDERLTGAFVKQCIPDDIYPDPCVSYLVVKRGASVTVSAGDARAGYWPVFDFVSGACNITGNGTDQTCTISLFQDADIVAVFSGGESPGLMYYQYPTCPTQRGNAPPDWTARCP